MNIGDLIPINGRQALICFTAIYNEKNYINVCFEDNDEYKVYQVVPDGEYFNLKAVTDIEILKNLTALWVDQELEAFEQENE